MMLSVLVGLLFAACINAPPGSAPAATSGEARQVAPDVEARPLAPGVWLHTSYFMLPGDDRFPSNGLVVQDGDSLILVDTAWGEVSTQQLVGWIDTAFQRPISHAVVTHGHYDRTAGAEVLRQRGVRVLGHPLAHRYAAGLGIPYPDTLAGIPVPGSAVRVGAVEMFYPEPGHAAENVMVWVPQARVLFGGCAVRALASSSLGNTADADLAA